MSMSTYIYIYTYIDRDRDIDIHTHTHFLLVWKYICTYCTPVTSIHETPPSSDLAPRHCPLASAGTLLQHRGGKFHPSPVA